MKEVHLLFRKHFADMCRSGKLFRSRIEGEAIWEMYIAGFSSEDNPVFRDPNSSTHDCKLCNNFLRRYGNIVALDEANNIITLFDIAGDAGEYKSTFEGLAAALKKAPIADIFIETYEELNSLPYERCSPKAAEFRLGVAENHKRYTREEATKYAGNAVSPDQDVVFRHLHLDLPALFVDKTGKSAASIMGAHRDAKNLFLRALTEIPLDTLILVKDLITQGSLLNGDAYLFKVAEFMVFKQEFDSLPADQRQNWAWLRSNNLPIARFRNELIGVLCTELAEGKELNAACKAWNMRVDPVNYMKVTAPISKRQIEEARLFVEAEGYTESFNRRLANIDDIKVSEILHANAGTGKIPTVSIFDSVKATSTRHKLSEFDKVEEVSIEKFMSDILPGCSSVSALFTGQHVSNLVTMTTANDPNSKPIFKWPNNYSWTFNGNLAGKSMITEAVKEKGGNVGGVLRFSLVWNDGTKDESDLDAWCSQPDGESIGFSTGYRKDQSNRFSSCHGQLDLDNTSPGGKLAVENIYFDSKARMANGVYKFWVNQYSARSSAGFKAEIEMDGETFTYEYNRPLGSKTNVQVAEVRFENGRFTIEHKLPESAGSKEVYGIETGQFHQVNLLCLSPNHWGDSQVGNKHYFFMLEGCKVDTPLRGFHNENLIPELLQHRKVMDVLADSAMLTPTDKQLSGLGFNATVRDELVVKLGGSHKRVLRIKF